MANADTNSHLSSLILGLAPFIFISCLSRMFSELFHIYGTFKFIIGFCLYDFSNYDSFMQFYRNGNATNPNIMWTIYLVILLGTGGVNIQFLSYILCLNFSLIL